MQRSATRRQRRAAKFSGDHYDVLGNMIKSMTDAGFTEAEQKRVADHFATEFYKRSRVFDPYQWNKRTGGEVDKSVIK